MGLVTGPTASIKTVVLGAALLLGAAATLLPALAVHALSCAELSVEEYVERSDAVLVGEIRSVHGAVAVERYLKGAGEADVTVRRDRVLWVYGGPWPESTIGTRYVFFVRGSSPFYRDTVCSGSRMLVPSQEEFLARVMAVTGPGVAPRETGWLTRVDLFLRSLSWAWTLGSTTFLAAVGAAGLAYVGRR